MGFLDGLKKGAAQGLVKQLNKKVEAGDKDAMVELGTMYLLGENVEDNPNEAYRLLKMAADMGDPVALNNIGTCYEYGAGVEKNLDLALEYYQNASAAGFAQGTENAERLQQEFDQDPLRNLLSKAEAGDVEAQAELGTRYTKGIDVEQNYQQAIKWLTPAAQSCHLDAQFYLGRLYAEEMNMPSEGLPWLEKAAESGSPDAQAKLGLYYASGKVVEKDLEKAIEYLRQAALQGKKAAADNLALAERQLADQKQTTATPQSAQPIQQSAPTENNCTQCGVGLQPGAKFCGGCGAKVEQVQFCTGCGTKIDIGTKFCGECGAAVGTPPTQANISEESLEPTANVIFDDDLEESYDFVSKAVDLLSEGQKDIANAHIQRALELAEDGNDIQNIAEFVTTSIEFEGFNDKVWGRQLYQQAAEEISGTYELSRLALSVADPNNLEDKEWAKELFKKASDAASDTEELKFVSINISDVLEDKTWARQLMEKALEKASDSDDFRKCGESFGQHFNDKEKARAIFGQAVDMATDAQAMLGIAEAVLDTDYLGDRNWAAELLNRAEEMIDNGECDSEDEAWLKEQLQENRSTLDKVSLHEQGGTDTISQQCNKSDSGTDYLALFNGIDSDLVSVVNLKIGYTQGELNATEMPDYDDGFKATSHVYWKYTIVMDNGGDTGCDWLLLDWANPGNTKCVSGDEEASEVLGELIEPSTEEMFGSKIPAVCFRSIIQAVLDEPDGYDFIEDILENLGGYIETTEGDNISDSFVNSLFALYEEFEPSAISIVDGKILVEGGQLDINQDYEETIAEKKYAAFSEDVMGL